MNISYLKLFEFRMIHDFFPNGLCRSLRVRPTSCCRAQLQKFALRYRHNEDGFSVYYPLYEEGDNAGLPIRAIDEEVRFSFAIFMDDPYFLNYSELPFVSPGKIVYHFSNLQVADSTENQNLSLSKDKYVAENDAILLRPKLFTEIVNADVEQILVMDDQNILIKDCLRKVEGEHVSYEIDLRRFDDGIYTLLVQGTPKTNFYASSELCQQKSFGIIDIYANNDVPVERQFVDIKHPENISPQVHVIHFAQRLTTWRYIVVPRSMEGSEANKLRVHHGKNVHRFTKGNDVHTTSGEKALVFQSEDTIPLSMNPTKDISLQVLRNGDDYVPLIPHLSSPKVSSIQIDPDTETVYSDVFVYI